MNKNDFEKLGRHLVNNDLWLPVKTVSKIICKDWDKHEDLYQFALDQKIIIALSVVAPEFEGLIEFDKNNSIEYVHIKGIFLLIEYYENDQENESNEEALAYQKWLLK